MPKAFGSAWPRLIIAAAIAASACRNSAIDARDGSIGGVTSDDAATASRSRTGPTEGGDGEAGQMGVDAAAGAGGSLAGSVGGAGIGGAGGTGGASGAGGTSGVGGTGGNAGSGGNAGTGGSGGPGGAALNASETAHAFGTVVLGTAGGTAFFTVSNGGGAASGRLSTAISGPNMSDFKLGSDTCNGQTLAPDTTCTLGVQVKPTASGDRTATLTISAMPGGTLVVTLNAKCVAAGALSISPASHDYLSAIVNSAGTPFGFTVSNAGGTTTASAPTVGISGGDPSAFNVTASDCNVPLAPGARCTVRVAFAPNSAGAKQATLTATGAGAAVAMLAGTATADLIVEPTGPGSGKVVSTPAGIDCGATCKGTFSKATVTLTATPAANSVFVGFSGGCNGSSPCQVTADAPSKSVSARFDLRQFLVSVTKAGSGTGTVTGGVIDCGTKCSAGVASGNELVLTAKPDSGSTFGGWTGCTTVSGMTCNLTVNAAATVMATFNGPVLAVPPALWYRFEGNGTNSGALSGYALSINNATYGPGKVGQAAVFGAGGYANVAGMHNVLGSFAQVTVSFWMTQSKKLLDQAFWDDNNHCCTAPFGGAQIGQTSSTGEISVCVNSRTSWLGGSCPVFASPPLNTWHHWIIRYNGTGLADGQGGPTEFYLDDVLMVTVPNDALNNPVFNMDGMPDFMTIGGDGVTMDDLRIYNRVFTPAEQCTQVIGGTWNGSSCALP